MEIPGNKTAFRWEVEPMKSANKRILIGFQIVAMPCFLIALIGGILPIFGYQLYLFGQVGGSVILLSFTLGIVVEGIMLLPLAIVNRKASVFLPNLILIPLVLVLLFHWVWSIAPYGSKVYHYDEFEKDIMITHWSFLVRSQSTVYQMENPFVVKEITAVVGDGIAPLDEDYFLLINVSEDGIEYYDHFENSDYEDRLILRLDYKDGQFTVAGKADE